MPCAEAMMQRWSRDTVRFMTDASQYGTYHRDLAQALLPYLPTQGHVCDAGCGLGHLALELSHFCKEVTAVDVSSAALEALMHSPHPENLHVHHGDIFHMSGQYDAMIFCYFGKAEEILSLAAKQCRGTVIVVRRDCNEHRFSATPVTRKTHSINHLTQHLQDLGIPYTTQNLSLELGQPFRSFDDARCFFRLYNKSDRPLEEEALRSKLMPIAHREFSFYYPNDRDMELIIFSATDLKNLK